MGADKKPGVKVKLINQPWDKDVPVLPSPFDLLFQYYMGLVSMQGKEAFRVSVDCLPPTVNHMYIHSRFATRLTEEAKTFRLLASRSAQLAQDRFSPKGCTSALITFESASWVTVKSALRQKDCDNRVKPLFDALEHGTQVNDLRHWQFHATKVLSNRERTTIYLFDLGDRVPYYLI